MKTRRVGNDRVQLHGDVLTVVTSRQMPGWDVRRYRAAIIRFDGRTWRVTSKTIGADQLTRYELVAWSPSDGELTGPEIDYSPDYVALRDHLHDTGRRRGRITLFLNLLSPLTGFLPAGVKGHLEALHGIDPVASTRGSVFIEFLVALGALVLGSIAQMVKIYGYSSGIPLGPVLLIAMISAADGAVRWSRVLAEERPPAGFYEWLFRRGRT